MNTVGEAFELALGMVVSADPQLWEIVGLSLRVSLAALALAAVLGLTLGAIVAVAQFPGRRAATVQNALRQPDRLH